VPRLKVGVDEKHGEKHIGETWTRMEKLGNIIAWTGTVALL
jgi:hypothetical protein